MAKLSNVKQEFWNETLSPRFAQQFDKWASDVHNRLREKKEAMLDTPPGYDAVGAYVWQVWLSTRVGEKPLLVLTNEPVPDADFKTIVDHHRKNESVRLSMPVDSVRVLEVKLGGFAQGTARHERDVPAQLDMSDGRVLISPEYIEKLRGIADKYLGTKEEIKAREKALELMKKEFAERKLDAPADVDGKREAVYQESIRRIHEDASSVKVDVNACGVTGEINLDLARIHEINASVKDTASNHVDGPDERLVGDRHKTLIRRENDVIKEAHDAPTNFLISESRDETGNQSDKVSLTQLP